ncbi:adenylyltransferase/cytidyltransferase family protein [Candidatus Dojkabacteria bacterium]|nr:adenylyltransferase/cytidyltransferase family protein [Candidatus Dojkabacteria bacterium]
MNKTLPSMESIKELAPSKVAFFAGSFNPPHMGHLRIAEKILAEYTDYFVFCPHSFNPRKKNRLAPLEHRRNLLSLLSEDSPLSEKILLCPENYDLGVQSIEFAKISEDLESSKISTFIVCGSDSFDYGYNTDIGHISHIIVQRNSTSGNYPMYLTGNYKIIPEISRDSSVFIRAILSQGGKHPVPKVDEYIKEQNLY